MLLAKKHYAMIEHASASYRVICDRGVTHEIVRHRLFSYAQESTRYCNYSGGVVYILPPWVDMAVGVYRINLLQETMYHNNTLVTIPPRTAEFRPWLDSLVYSEMHYQELITSGWTPQQARSVLPNSLKTEIVITGNLREWLHFFTLRCATDAHPQMREVAFMLLDDIRSHIPILFDEITAELK